LLLAAIVVGAGSSLLLQHAVDGLQLAPDSYAPDLLVTLGTSTALCIGAFVAGRWGRSVWASLVCQAAVASIATLVLALPLHGTPWYLDGWNIDNTFRTELLTRMAAPGGTGHDFVYPGLPSFYPWAWFWVAARYAHLAGLAPWAAYKPFAILSISVTAALAFTLWRLVTRTRLAFALAVATVLAGCVGGRFAGVFEPYSWVCWACLPPLVVLTCRQFVPPPGAGAPRPSWSTLAALGLAAGLGESLYTMWLPVYGLSAGCGLALALALQPGRRVVILRRLLRGAVLVGAAGVAAVGFWWPFLVAEERAGSPANAGQKYLPEGSTRFAMPMLEFTPVGMLCLAGAAWALIAASRSRTALALLGCAAGCYLWQAASMVEFFAGTSLLGFRMEVVLRQVLACAGVFALRDLAALARRVELQRQLFVLGLAGAIAATQSGPIDSLAGLVTAADAEPCPGPCSLDQQVFSAITRLTHRPSQDVNLLTDDPLLMDVYPFTGFLATTDAYSNPLGDYDARATTLADWAAAPNATAFDRDLAASPWRVPDVFVLTRTPQGLRFDLSRNIFPAEPNDQWYQIEFRPADFDQQRFATTDIGPYEVIARK
jgi:galactan 5-O-arabinofuranosyltransferase